ncbi:hypothetical protein QH494_13835 [Sphingomonas sp. AR_OL41]|uniref:hypothetical protein n=1 Tax=Sphingomonas sp. AR_OL41 TaxID=3042729 RepID=UPI002480C81C|nr:hypothetical protein [Sphingomonas sp. AR_OL41]MDH7973265.1 hypothetical protein [Sphingomonas sp. AR_OL41]
MTLTSSRAADIYRRTLTSSDAEPTCWWYLGTTTFVTDGHPEIIVNHVETAMLYRAEPLDGGAFRVPWWEIGVFRDAITGEIANQWTNPLSGETLSAARKFEEGPSGYTIRPAGDGIELVDAVQAMAKLEKATVTVIERDGRVAITQLEEKVRSFPARDGIPDLDEGQSKRSKTVLQWFADAADLASDAPSVPSTGIYSFTIGAPPWLGMGDRQGVFSVKGLMHKAPLEQPLNRRGWADLKVLFPEYFDGETIQPRWR